jgi:hypothetical protein
VSRRGNGDHAGLSSPDSKAGRLQRACLTLLREHERNDELPTSVRFLFYELEQRGVVPKHYDDLVHQPPQEVTNASMHLRKIGLVPWRWIVDETRSITEWRFASSVYEYAVNAVEDARIDAWDGQPAPLIICESRATKGVLSRIASNYLADITATGGQAGGFLVTDIVPKIIGNVRPILYIGDFEWRGPADQIEANTRRYLEQHAERTFDPETWIRVALIQEQVDRNPRLRRLVMDKLDRRYRPARRYQAVECEAVGQTALETMLRRQLDRMLPAPLQEVLHREERQRAQVRRLLAKLGKPQRPERAN